MDAVDHTYSQATNEQSVMKTRDIQNTMEKRKRSPRNKAKDQDKPYGCSECHKRFTRKGDMYRHLRTHTGEKPFSCPECGDEFSRKDDMIRHLRTHTGLKPFDCTHCDRKFSRRADMYKHMVTHAGVKIKQNSCPTCGCQNSNHCHDNPQPPVVRKRGRPKGSTKGFIFHKCTLCSRAFRRKRDMTRHLRTHSLLDIVNIASGNVNTGMTNKENESHHENVQMQVVSNDSMTAEACETIIQEAEEEATTTIPECKVVVISNSENGLGPPGAIQIVTTNKALQNALLGIKNDKPFHCPQCGDKFGRKSDMIRHLRIHSGLKPYNCNLCGRPFSRKEDMNRHTLTHSGVKPYSCSICTKSFARKSDFEMHSTLHSMEVCPVQCQSEIVEADSEN